MSRYNTVVTAANPKSCGLYNLKNRTGYDIIDVSFIEHADPTLYVVIDRQADYDSIREVPIETAREYYKARVAQGYTVHPPTSTFLGIDFCGRYENRRVAPANWPEARR